MSLAALLLKHKKVVSLLPSNKVKCAVTGHEMPPDVTVVQNHLNGKKLKKALAKQGQDLTRFLPHIVPNVEDEKKMFCKLTGFTLNPNADEIERHMGGRKFIRLRGEFEELAALKAKKIEAKEERKKEKQEMEKAGIWVPNDDVLRDDSEGEDDDGAAGAASAEGDDDDMQSGDEDEDEDDGEGRGVAMDEESDSDDEEDWIITSRKLGAMKRNGIAAEDDEVIAIKGAAVPVKVKVKVKARATASATVTACDAADKKNKRSLKEATTKKKKKAGEPVAKRGKSNKTLQA